jgi:hypothetical protein
MTYECLNITQMPNLHRRATFHVVLPLYTTDRTNPWTGIATEEESIQRNKLYAIRVYIMDGFVRVEDVSMEDYLGYKQDFVTECKYPHYVGGRRAMSRAPKWQPTQRSVVHKGRSRKVWRNAHDASVFAIKRAVKAADGSRKFRFEKI